MFEQNHAAKTRQWTAVLLALLVASGFVTPAAAAPASDPHAHHRNMAQQQSEPSQDRITLPDTALITQNGDERRLASDIVAGRIVVIDFVYTSCTTVCPVLSAILRQVQGRLDGRIGNEVMLVSISVDPVRDTPARLKAYADKLRAGDGWVWLTGDKQAVDGVLEQLGAYSPNFEDHPSMVLVGDAENGDWARFLGFPGADQIVAKVDQLTASRNMQAAKREQ
ncbi:MAG: SCO family protein [Pseudomonadota bacterium]|nr:SCO family protein [Pseudomonadota bacterium]